MSEAVLRECRDALGSANVQAFLRLIRAGETSQDDRAYRMMFGGGLFDNFDDHPRVLNHAAGLASTAAGAYQFLSRTWDGCVKALSLPDFSPAMQDLAAVYLIRGRGALADVIAGQIHTAIAKCCREWASLPGSPYGQPTRTMAQALETYHAYGGHLAGEAIDTSSEHVETEPETVHIPTPTWSPLPGGEAGEPQPERKMPLPAILGALLPSLIESIPKLGKLFGSGSAVAERNVKAAEIAMSIAQETLGATNAQEAVEKIKADPGAAQAVARAVEGRWYELVEAGGGGIDGARKMNAAAMAPGSPGFWLNPAFWISIAMLLMPFMMLVDVFYVHPDAYSENLRTQVVTGVLVVIGVVGGYWLGSSMGSAKKDERMQP